MKRKNRRKPRRDFGWIVIHDALANIQARLRVYKTTKDFFRLTYFGQLKTLRHDCIRMLNAIDRLQGKEALTEESVPHERWE